MVNFQEKYHFSKFRRGSKIFQGGSTFTRWGGGGPIVTQITCDFPGGGPDPRPENHKLFGLLLVRTPCRPLDPHLAVIYLVSRSAK